VITAAFFPWLTSSAARASMVATLTPQMAEYWVRVRELTDSLSKLKADFTSIERPPMVSAVLTSSAALLVWAWPFGTPSMTT
jgi:hypothetical protein